MFHFFENKIQEPNDLLNYKNKLSELEKRIYDLENKVSALSISLAFKKKKDD